MVHSHFRRLQKLSQFICAYMEKVDKGPSQEDNKRVVRDTMLQLRNWPNLETEQDFGIENS